MALTQISTSGIKDSNVTSADIADQAVTLDKLPHGTSSNNGKFLRANNGADPTFETVNTNLVADTSPQLGGDLASNGHDIVLADTDLLKVGTGGDMLISHDGTNSTIHNLTGNLRIRTVGQLQITKEATENMIVGIPDGAVELYHNNVKSIETTATGTSMVDGKFAKFGNSDDLSVGHNTYNYITYSNADLLITGDNTNQVKIMPRSDEAAAVFKPNAEVALYYDGVKKFETGSNYSVVTGIANGNPAGLKVTNSDPNSNYSHAELRLISKNGASYGVIYNDHANSNVRIGHNTTGNTLEIFNNGNIRSQGIVFGSDSAAANHLHDYEEGTFTPTILGNNSSSNQSGYAWRYGSYTKVGRIVHVRIAFGLSDGFASNFTSCFIGLPLTSYSDHGNSNFDYVPILGYNYNSGKGDSGSNEGFYVECNGHAVDSFRIVKGNGKSNINQNDLATGQRFTFNFCYQGAA